MTSVSSNEFYLYLSSPLVDFFMPGSFTPNYKLTIGVDFALKVLYWDEMTKINLQLW